MRQVIAINANIRWAFARDPESGHWVAECAPLKLTVSGATHAELLETIAQGMDAFLHDLWETGELERFFQDHGWQAGKILPPRPTADTAPWFDVPFELVAKAQRDSARAVH